MDGRGRPARENVSSERVRRCLEENAEGCAYFTFHVYRADGVLVKLTFNHTD